MRRKYLHWGEQERYALLGETREVPKAPMPTLTPLDSFDTPLFPDVATDADIKKAVEKLRGR